MNAMRANGQRSPETNVVLTFWTTRTNRKSRPRPNCEARSMLRVCCGTHDAVLERQRASAGCRLGARETVLTFAEPAEGSVRVALYGDDCTYGSDPAICDLNANEAISVRPE